MLWTPEQQQAARAEGWELIDTVDNGTTWPKLRVYGTKCKNQVALEHVMKRARGNSQLHVEALRAIVQSGVKPRSKK